MSKSLILVLIAVFLLVLGTFISGTILTPYAQDIGATWFQIGILSGSMYAVRLFIGTPVGRLADRKGTLTVLKYSLLLYPFIAVAYYFSFNIYSLICARLFHGVASAMMLPVCMAYVGQASPEGMEGKYMGMYNLCILLASGIGPFISTAVASLINYRATFIILFVIALLSLLIVSLSHGEQVTERENFGSPNTYCRKPLYFIVLLKNKGLLALSLANIALAIISSLVGFFFIPFLKTRGMDLIFTGLILAVYNIVSGIVQLPLGRIIDNYNKRTTALLAGIVTSAAMLIFPLSHSILLMGIAIILTSIGSAALLSATSALSIVLGREKGMGSTMGFLSTSNSIGMILGCILLSLMPGTGNNYEAFFYFSSAAVSVCTILFVILWFGRKAAVL